MINFWRLFGYIFDFLYHFFWKNKKVVAKHSDSARCPNEHRHSKLFEIEKDDSLCSKIADTTFSENRYSINLVVEDYDLRKRFTQPTNRITQPENKATIPKTDIFHQQEVIMKRNYTRRSSKRFVIGDGEDEFETIPQMPDVTITESIEEPSCNVWNKENSDGRLSVRSTLT